MSITLADISIVDWVNTVIGIVGLVAAGFALLQTRRSNKAAAEANSISRGANELAGQANRYAERALQLQEEEGLVRLVVKPSMLFVAGDDDNEDLRRRPIVEVVNLSAFPVTVTSIRWKAAGAAEGKQWYIWKNPTVANPFGKLPARLPPREALIAIGIPTTFGSLDDLASITAAVAYTACGEKFEGMTDQWREAVAEMLTEGKSGEAARKS